MYGALTEHFVIRHNITTKVWNYFYIIDRSLVSTWMNVHWLETKKSGFDFKPVRRENMKHEKLYHGRKW